MTLSRRAITVVKLCLVMIYISFLFLSLLLQSSVRDVCGRPIIEQETIAKVAALKDEFMRNVDSGVEKAKTFLADKFSRVKDYLRQRDPSENTRKGKLNKARLNDYNIDAVEESHHPHHAPKRQKVSKRYKTFLHRE